MNYDDHISVVIPAYNESRDIIQTLTKVTDYLNNHFNSHETIVIDDGSLDDTFEKASKFSSEHARVRVFRNESNRGKGYSVRRGMLMPEHGYVLFADADLSAPIEDVEKLLAVLKKGADVAAGSRMMSGSQIIKYQPLPRRLMGRFFNAIIHLLLFRGIRDTQCGFKCLSVRAARTVFSVQTLDRFCFDVEMLYIARKKNLKVEEVAISWADSENSTVRVFPDALLMFLDLFKIRINDWLGAYA